jgi:hypothetical protein
MSEVWHRGSQPLRHHRRSKFVGEFLPEAGSEPQQANSWKEAQMLHPALRRALATAHIEDLHRAATPRQTIRLQQGGLKPREGQAGVRRK